MPLFSYLTEYATVKPRIPAGGAKLPGMGGMMGGALLAEMKAKHKSIHPLSEGVSYNKCCIYIYK